MRASLLLSLTCALALPASQAFGYGFMIRHEYTSCAQCHADPSGGGLLTPYGRAQSDLLLRTRYGSTSEEPSRAAQFLFGFGTLPESVSLGGSLRLASVLRSVKGALGPARFFPMQADLLAQWAVGRARFNLSAGAGSEATLPASVAGRFISRVHWAGVALGEDDSGLIRVGRMNLPYGVRSLEHPLWARSATQTDVNLAQQHGVSFAWTGEHFRGEAMWVAGNFQLAPPEFRERGYSGFLEWVAHSRFALGASSQITHAQRALETASPRFRHAHGVFARASPLRALVLSLEANALLSSQPGLANRWGHTGFLQADWEPVQGLHLVGTGEWLKAGGASTQSASYGGWASLLWFFAPHFDVRADLMARWLGADAASEAAENVTTPQLTLLVQLHLSL